MEGRRQLDQDLRPVVNNPVYSDVEILCGDGKKLSGYGAILAIRSKNFEKLIYKKTKKEKQISFPEINSSVMEIVLEYVYTGSIQEESLITKDNVVEVFNAADYFKLQGLKNFTAETSRNTLKNYSPELLSKVAKIMPPTEKNILISSLAEAVATIPLDTIEFGRLSIEALQHLLSHTHKKEYYFATPEYEAFRYSAILAAKQVSDDAYKTFMEQLPTLEQIKDPIQVENKIITDYQRVAKVLEPLTKFFDLSLIKGQILFVIVEPLKIVPAEIIENAYRDKALSDCLDLNYTRGAQLSYNAVWDAPSRGSRIVIEDNGKVACVTTRGDRHRNSANSVRAKLLLEGKGNFEWDIIIEEKSFQVCVGVVSAADDFDYENSATSQSKGWVLCDNGSIQSNKQQNPHYCPPFQNARITVHLDMNKNTCAFTVNDTKYPEVKWRNLASKLYPVVSICHTGRIRIQNFKGKKSV